MSAAAERHDGRRAGAASDGWLWFAVTAGAVVWAARFTASYALVETACATGWWWLLPLLSAAGVLITAAAGLVGWRAWQRLPDAERPALGRMGSRPGFMALAGMVSSALFIMVTLAESLPLIWINPCA